MNTNVCELQDAGLAVGPFLETSFNLSRRLFSNPDTAGDEATLAMNSEMHKT
jgi:hypothetical protein